MQDLDTSKKDFNDQNEQTIRVLTTEEILAVAGGPEVDVEAGAGGG